MAEPNWYRIRCACRDVAARDTAYEPLEHLWSKRRPLAEHCGAVAYAVYKMFGGEIMTGRDRDGVRWLWNKLPDGQNVALTAPTPLPIRRRPMKIPKRFNERWVKFYERLEKRLKK